MSFNPTVLICCSCLLLCSDRAELWLLAEYVDELKRCTPSYSHWATLDADLAEPLRGVAGCVERCCLETEEHIQHLSELLLPAVHEYVLCADTVKVSADAGWLAGWQSSSIKVPV